jgi:hypothetical protein
VEDDKEEEDNDDTGDELRTLEALKTQLTF